MSKDKPQGASGPIVVAPDGIEWQVTRFPNDKAARELLVAQLFVSANLITEESEPSLAPFGGLQQNDENDIDFRVLTPRGQKLLELTEFAPLKEHGPAFKNAPRQLPPSEKAGLALELIKKKSRHQGGPDRILAIYSTEHAFQLDAITIELLRRACGKSPPNFERVFSVMPVTIEAASITEIYPGKPHFYLGSWTDEQLSSAMLIHTHPDSMKVVQGPGFVEAMDAEAAQSIAKDLGANPNYSIGPIRRNPKP